MEWFDIAKASILSIALLTAWTPFFRFARLDEFENTTVFKMVGDLAVGRPRPHTLHSSFSFSRSPLGYSLVHVPCFSGLRGCALRWPSALGAREPAFCGGSSWSHVVGGADVPSTLVDTEHGIRLVWIEAPGEGILCDSVTKARLHRKPQNRRGDSYSTFIFTTSVDDAFTENGQQNPQGTLPVS